MNGFTNAILSILLSWIRLLVAQGWALINSEGGGHFFQFLSQHWKGLVLILCVGGFVIDRIIYLFRWRPYYVWSSKLHRMRRQRREEPLQSEEGWDEDAYPQESEENDSAPAEDWPAQASPYAAPEGYAAAAYQPQDTRYAPPAQQIPAAPEAAPMPQPSIPYAPAQPAFGTAAAYAPQQAPAVQATPFPDTAGATVHYAPIGSGFPSAMQPYAPPAPPQELTPVFDDDLGGWAQGDTVVGRPDNGLQGLSDNMAHAYGSAKPEPIAYLRDMQAGFAKPVTPEQLYRPAAVPQPVSAPEEPVMPDPHGQVHPGLNMDAFRRNIGLSPAASLSPEELTSPSPILPEEDSFVPYQNDHVQETPARSRNPLSQLAKKARGLVGVTEDEDKPTIRDLHSTVDVRTAFHKPVYPKPKAHKEGDDL